MIPDLIIKYHRGTDGKGGHNWSAVCRDLSMRPLSYHIPISDRFLVNEKLKAHNL